MSTDHRKPVVAFVLLMFIAAALIFVQRADARSARFFAGFIGGTGEIQGAARVPGEVLWSSRPRERTIEHAIEALSDHGQITGSTRLQGALFGRGRAIGPRHEDRGASRDRRERPGAREKQSEARHRGGKFAGHAAGGRGVGAREGRGSLGSRLEGTKSGFGRGPSGDAPGRRALGRATHQVRDRVDRLPEQSSDAGPR